jgi:hypothetical protein
MQPVGHGNGFSQVIPATPLQQALPTLPPTRVYAVVPQENSASRAMAEGTFLINDMPARVLFDSGATHSFM